MIYKETTRLRFGFKSRKQRAWFMIWREWRVGSHVTFAAVVFKIG